MIRLPYCQSRRRVLQKSNEINISVATWYAKLQSMLTHVQHFFIGSCIVQHPLLLSNAWKFSSTLKNSTGWRGKNYTCTRFGSSGSLLAISSVVKPSWKSKWKSISLFSLSRNNQAQKHKGWTDWKSTRSRNLFWLLLVCLLFEEVTTIQHLLSSVPNELNTKYCSQHVIICSH